MAEFHQKNISGPDIFTYNIPVPVIPEAIGCQPAMRLIAESHAVKILRQILSPAAPVDNRIIGIQPIIIRNQGISRDKHGGSLGILYFQPADPGVAFPCAQHRHIYRVVLLCPFSHHRDIFTNPDIKPAGKHLSRLDNNIPFYQVPPARIQHQPLRAFSAAPDGHRHRIASVPRHRRPEPQRKSRLHFHAVRTILPQPGFFSVPGAIRLPRIPSARPGKPVRRSLLCRQSQESVSLTLIIIIPGRQPDAFSALCKRKFPAKHENTSVFSILSPVFLKDPFSVTAQTLDCRHFLYYHKSINLIFLLLYCLLREFYL